MAAYVIVATQEQWSFLRGLGEGAVVVSPDAAKQFREKHGCDLPDWIEYDFGGDPDRWIDLVDDFLEPTNRYAAEAIEAGLEDDEEEFEDESDEIEGEEDDFGREEDAAQK
jgi:hypothetical protein